jgi:hypothetical protein
MRSEFNKLTKPLDPINVENMLGSGTPDVNMSTCWCELKYSRLWPKRSQTPLTLPHFTVEQKMWLRRREAAGQPCYLVLQAGGTEWFVFTAEQAQAVGTLCREDLIKTAYAYFPKKPTSEQLCAVLRRTL